MKFILMNVTSNSKEWSSTNYALMPYDKALIEHFGVMKQKLYELKGSIEEMICYSHGAHTYKSIMDLPLSLYNILVEEKPMLIDISPECYQGLEPLPEIPALGTMTFNKNGITFTRQEDYQEWETNPNAEFWCSLTWKSIDMIAQNQLTEIQTNENTCG